MTCSEEQKVTTALLKVDLDCYQCYKKIKRTLCGVPQIRNQVYDDKQNTVTITVVCCSPERVLDKLCSKAGKTIKSVHIVKPSSAPAPTKKPDSGQPKQKPAAPAPAPAPEKPSAPAPEPEKPKQAKPASDDKPAVKKNGSKNGGSKPVAAPAPAPAPAPSKPAEEAPKQAAPKPNEPAQFTEPVPQWVPGYPPGPPPQVFPVAVYGPPPPCYDGGYHHQGGYGPGPGYYQYGRPPCQQPGYYGNRCDYFSEENPSACSIM